MFGRGARRCLAVATAALGVVAVAGTPAWAPKYILGANAYGTCVFPDGSTARFEGAFTVLGFSAPGGVLSVTGAVAGSCLGDGDAVATVPGGSWTFPVTSLLTDCTTAETAVVQFRPGAATVDAVTGPTPKDGEQVKTTLDLASGTTLERDWFASDPVSLRARLCAADRAARHARPAGLAQALNALVVRA
ncbi:MAG TPA: hypothetical protein VFQ85_17350 [Mycobacteriales bacterium]|nr:hypothetical protein [Mycobacteriales bacterium]